jgi:hypothetical protein
MHYTLVALLEPRILGRTPRCIRSRYRRRLIAARLPERADHHSDADQNQHQQYPVENVHVFPFSARADGARSG